MDDLEVVASGKTRLASGSVLLDPLRSQILMVWSNDPDAIQRCSRLRRKVTWPEEEMDITAHLEAMQRT